ncbi:MAG: replication initiator protein [Microvirus sp.]|nr:MAG: replication initiator protein [Microvirus sp.]
MSLTQAPYRLPYVICANPWKEGTLQGFSCGQCLPCRFNRRRLWTHRIQLEAKLHDFSTFVTLTYSDDSLPDSGSLSIRDYQLFIKRLRKRLSGVSRQLRFFAVGEYGDDTGRAHYHVVLFGVAQSEVDTVQRCWDKGHVRLDRLDAGLAQYLAKYTVKRLTAPDDPRLPPGRQPEFARMSLRPGIGRGYLDKVASKLCTPPGQQLIERTGDVPQVLRTDGKLLPLGRYLTNELRKTLGREPGAPPLLELAKRLELRDLYPTLESLVDYSQARQAERQQKVRQSIGRAAIIQSKSIPKI